MLLLIPIYAFTFAIWLLVQRRLLVRIDSRTDRQLPAAFLHLGAGLAVLTFGTAQRLGAASLVLAAFVIPGGTTWWAANDVPYTPWWRRPGW